jgi:hypothetical protein
MNFLFKYRAAAGNPENGNYVVTAMLAASVPTGTYTVPSKRRAAIVIINVSVLT